MNDPMETLVAEALRAAGHVFTTDEGGGNKAGLDFHLTGPDVHIEVKRFHSDRIAAQLGRVENAVALQGEGAIRFFADLLRAAEIVRAPLASIATAGALIDLSGAVDAAWRRLLEVDDRNSPVEYPDMLLVTKEELARAMDDAVEVALPVIVERCAVAAEAQDRIGREWVRDSLWAEILKRAGANVRATLHHAAAGAAREAAGE